MIKILKNELLYQWIRLRIWYYQSALDHLDPIHPDVPDIVFRLLQLQDEEKLLQAERWKS